MLVSAALVLSCLLAFVSTHGKPLFKQSYCTISAMGEESLCKVLFWIDKKWVFQNFVLRKVAPGFNTRSLHFGHFSLSF